MGRSVKQTDLFSCGDRELEGPNGARRTHDLEALNEVDWTFLDADTRTHTHGVHPYPAKFIPQIPRELIARLHPRDGSMVFDPFCGSGTTLVEAGLAGVPAVGVDLSPIACLIAKVKTTPLATMLRPIAMEVANRARVTSHRIPDIPRLDHWFQPHIQQVLASLVVEIERTSDSHAADALRVALSNIIVRVSNQDSDTRYAAVHKSVSSENAYELFLRSAGSLEDALTKTWGQGGKSSLNISILNRDILEVDPDEVPNGVSLVITSTPYPNAYEYWLYHKYRMYWLGMDPLAVRKREIGARPHYFRKKPLSEVDFEQQMVTCFRLLSAVMRPTGFACFLIGRSVIHGRRIDNAAILQRAATSSGFVAQTRLKREIPSTRKAFNPSHGTIREEDLLVFEYLP